ncbi:MFS transporter [Halobacillus seohaensis]|uniref:MFS transporter n=1 Tax=Halobacillus seohaensis TaxID=447421 RepID=A0ABW2EP50_9BACI
MNKKNTNKLLSGYFLYECGRAMYFVLITWFLYKWTNDAMYTGFLISFGFLPGLFSNVIFGVLVDRYNRKILANIAGGISVLVLGVLWSFFAFGSINPWWVIITHMVLQTTGSLFRPSLQALVAEVFKEEELPRIFSLSGSATISGSLVGAGLGGVFSSFLSIQLSIFLVMFLYIGAFFAIVALIYEPSITHHQSAKPSFFSELRSGFTYLNSHRMLYGIFVMMMLGQLTFHTTLGFLSVYTSDYLNKPAIMYGALDVTFSIGGITAGILGAWWWKRMKNHLATYSLSAVALGLLLLGITHHVISAFIGVLLIGLGTSFVRALLQSVQQMATSKEYHGRMASFRMLCNQTAVVLSGPLFGFVAESNGANFVFLSLLAPICLGIAWSFFQSKHPLYIKITHSKTA